MRERLNGYYGISSFVGGQDRAGRRAHVWRASRRWPAHPAAAFASACKPGAALPALFLPAVSNTLASLPFIFLIAVVSTVAVYWLADLRGGAGYVWVRSCSGGKGPPSPFPPPASPNGLFLPPLLFPPPFSFQVLHFQSFLGPHNRREPDDGEATLATHCLMQPPAMPLSCVPVERVESSS